MAVGHAGTWQVQDMLVAIMAMRTSAFLQLCFVRHADATVALWAKTHKSVFLSCARLSHLALIHT